MSGPWEKFKKAPQSEQKTGPWSKFKKPEPAQGPGIIETVVDAGASALSGVARGTADLVGLPGTLADLGQAGFDAAKSKAYELATGEKPKDGFFAPLNRENMLFGGRNPIGGSVLRDGVSAATGGASDYEPKTTTGKYAATVGEFVPGAVALGGGTIANVVKNAVLPGLGSEAGGQLTEGTAFEPYARVAGAVVGGMVPAATRKIITPNPVSPERAAASKKLMDEGIDITAGQKTGNVNLRNMESELGGAAVADKFEKQGEQFTRAALKRAGISADRATPDVIDNAFTELGKKFDDLAANNTLVPDTKFSQDMSSVVKEYNSLVNESARAPIVVDTIADIATMSKNGISGEAYQAIRSRLDKAARSSSRDPQLSDALFSIRNSLDAAMERSIAKANPGDLGAWKEVRNQYKNMLVIEKAATGPGENAAMGIISPSKLRHVAAQQNKRAYARGKGDFAELARSGEAILKPLPNSGTAGRNAARNMLASSLPTAMGAGAGTFVAGLPGAIAGAAAGAMAPAVAGRLLLSKPVSGYLSNQLLPQSGQVALPALGAGAQGVAHEGASMPVPERWPRRSNTKQPSPR